jgi:hyperosmotically inducible periplasmic protein
MVRAFLRLVILVVVLVAVGAFLLGWWGNRKVSNESAPRETVGTTGVDTERAREVGAKVGERTAAAANEARQALTDGQITAKIKGKLALDDSVKASAVDVDTNGTTVTVTGTVDSQAQRDRILRLARETQGVKEVVDRITVR